jgi:hypothetical protein
MVRKVSGATVRLPVERWRLCTIHVVPPVARELVLVEEGAVGTEKRSALVALPSVVADVVRLYRCNTAVLFS